MSMIPRAINAAPITASCSAQVRTWPVRRDDAVLGVRGHVAVVGDQRGAVQRLLDVQVDLDRVEGVADLDVVADVADPGQAGHGRRGGSALRAVGHGPGQGDVAVLRGRLHAVRHGDVGRERVVGRRGQLDVVTVVAFRQRHLQVVVHPGHPGDPPRGGGRLQVLGVARHGAGEGHVSGDVPDGDIRGVDQRVEAEFGLDCRADVLGLAYWVLAHLPASFRWAGRSLIGRRYRLARWAVRDEGPWLPGDGQSPCFLLPHALAVLNSARPVLDKV